MISKEATFKEAVQKLIEFREELFQQLTWIVEGYPEEAFYQMPFAGFIEENGIEEFYITGADATGCVKSTSYNLVKAGYKVQVISD